MPATDIGTLIVKSPETLGGRPRIAGTRVSVQRITAWYKLGLNAEEIAERFIRDLDNQPERREGLEQARSEHINRQPQLKIVIGTANPKREAWVLNGFLPSNQEEQILEQIKARLNFDPCIEPHRLRSTSHKEPDRIRNPKVVVEQLTGKDMEREQKCWEDTSLNLLRERGVHTGLTAYIQEIEQHLTQIILSE